MLNETQKENCHGNRGCVSESNRKQRANDCRAALFLQAKRERKQPAHGGIQTVVGPEKRQGNPWPIDDSWVAVEVRRGVTALQLHLMRTEIAELDK